MQELYGEYDCKVDAKGRLRLPSDLLLQMKEADLGINFMINRGFENCLCMFPMQVWESVRLEINQLNYFSKEDREFLRYFSRGLHRITPDKTDRISLNKRLLAYAGIESEVILSVVQNRIEIWEPARYDAVLNQEPENYENVADRLLGNNMKFQGGDAAPGASG